MTTLRAATRGSPLALWQTHHVAKLLESIDASIEIEIVVVSTAGDRDKTTPLHEIGGKGVFVKEVQAAVLDGRADFAVHSAKDLPALTPDGLTIAGVPARADRRDALIGSTLANLASGDRIGTGSARRRVQLEMARPDIEVVDIRGNIDTRLGLVGELDAIVMAAAALHRLGREPGVVEPLETTTMVPQVGQGALAIEAKSSATDVCAVLSGLDDPTTKLELVAERAFLRELGGDCDLPAGATAVRNDAGSVTVRGLLSERNRTETVELTGTDPDQVGTKVAQSLIQLLQ